MSPGRVRTLITFAAAIVACAFGGPRAPAPGPAAAAPVPGNDAVAVPVTPSAEAAAAAAVLQRWYLPSSYRHTRSWQSANALSATIAYMRASGSRAYISDLMRTYRARHGSGGFLGTYFDDEGWWALAWIRAYELTRNGLYLAQARVIFADMATGWDSTCGGGIWWSTNRAYKNAIANELFLDVAARLHNLVPGDTLYAGWATREWDWFRRSGLLTGAHLVVDGLAGCQPIVTSPTWTYNQGVLIGGLVALERVTGDTSLLATAARIARAVMNSSELSPHGILREPCEPAGTCGVDRPMFKGIFILNLKTLYDRVGGAPYREYLRRNASSVWARDRNGDEFGLHWAGPFDRAGTARQASVLDLLITQVTPGAARPALRERPGQSPGISGAHCGIMVSPCDWTRERS